MLLIAIASVIAISFFLGKQTNVAPLKSSSMETDSARPEASPSTGSAERASEASQSQARARVTDSGALIPPRHALFPGMRVPLVSSWEELVEGLDAEDREVAIQLALSYPEAYQFSTPEQLAWMIENGYPMPEEYVIASRMELSQLEAMGHSGNTKAAMLAYDRIVNELVSDEALLAGPDDERMGRLSEMERAMQKSGCSPFPYLMQGRRELARSERGSQRSQVQELYGALASYAVASNLGERRIDAMLRQISAGLPQEPHTMADVAKLAAHYRARSASDCNAGRIPR